MGQATTTGGFLLVLAIFLPVVGVFVSLALAGRQAERVTFLVMPAGLAVAVAIAARIWRTQNVLQYFVGGWAPPLGVAFRADGLSAVMILASALLICGIGLFARAQFTTARGTETRAPLMFWVLLLAVWAALNMVFVGGDLFSLYVALELLTFAAVPLVCLDGRRETIAAALQYLLFALLGSILYLLGAVLLFGAYGTLDITLLSRSIHAEPVTWTALSLMTAGLLAKAALYPFHLWLPPAHAGAPAPASAILSGLVIKAPFFLTVRLWFDVAPGIPESAAAQVLGILGAARDNSWQRRGAAPSAAEAAYRVFDGSANRLSLSDVSACDPSGGRKSVGYSRLDRRDSASRLACLCEGGNVHGGGTDRRGAGARPDYRSCRRWPGPSDHRFCLCSWWHVADGIATERRLYRQSHAADHRGRRRPMVVGAGCYRWRSACRRLCLHRSRPSDRRPDRTAASAGGGRLLAADGGGGRRVVRGVARLRAAAAFKFLCRSAVRIR